MTHRFGRTYSCPSKALDILNMKDVIVGNIYKPTKDNYNIENINTFTTEIENGMHELDRRNSEIIIAGDYNTNLLNIDVRQAFSDFLTAAKQL